MSIMEQRDLKGLLPGLFFNGHLDLWELLLQGGRDLLRTVLVRVSGVAGNRTRQGEGHHGFNGGFKEKEVKKKE